MTWFYAIASTFVVSFVSFIGIFALSFRADFLKKFIFIVVSISVGALFGDAFIHLIPEAIEQGLSPEGVALPVIIGILVFFALEKFMRWHHTHAAPFDCDECGEMDTLAVVAEHERKSLGAMILVADGFHNFLDGVIIGLAFLVSVPIGIATVLAVILHEIPQEISDFGILLHAGYTRAKALLWNFFSALFAVVGVLAALIAGNTIENIIPFGIAAAAGGFIYIAGSDLVPELHKTKELKKSLLQIFAIILGLVLMLLLTLVE
jgi:zinc and cadmium transporter